MADVRLEEGGARGGPPPGVRDPEYLGDGVYVGHDGYQLVLWLESPGAYGPNSIALEPSVLAALGRYTARLGGGMADA